ncbi:MAG: hypothetical protein OXN89_20795 [Bryobacterales bacterium]|nr:hypothetical protein [Bryobacterales bacterium]
MSLDRLWLERYRILGEIGNLGDFRTGSLAQRFQRCGKPKCRCADPERPGHGPCHLLKFA